MRTVSLCLLLVALFCAKVSAQTIPAVYYKLYYVVKDGANDRVDTIDANGGGEGTIISRSTGSFSDSIAFDGAYLYVVEGGSTILRFTPGVPSAENAISTMITNITCLGIGHSGELNTGPSIMYFGVAAGGMIFNNATNMTMPSTEPLLYTMQLDNLEANLDAGQPPTITQVSKWASGDCQYLVQEREFVLFSTTEGTMYKYNTSNPMSDAILVNSTGNSTVGALTSVSASNLLLYTSGRQIRFNYLDAFLDLVPEAPVDALWHTTDGNATSSLITLNGAVVSSADVGTSLYFAPFSDTGSQRAARTILANNPNVKGMATDLAAKQLVNMLLIFAALFSVMLVL